ncbi:hypothetical protein VaNZ11_012116 [Volvox africanus]|uniref:Telomeric single stranded DNA binding POT1/Cdc13 domain-containing protein n=1 Tax=Volvox africanus TaxID=51714 RepID=A0ABQ5SEF7_9CHLO|nr:hypothetical protein VaNZ11_012116 [Volvox africanus]
MRLRTIPLKTLREAVHGPQLIPISVCAWVTWFSPIRQSSGLDHYMLLHLSDDSLSMEDMPAIRDPSRERQHEEPPYVTCAIFGAHHLLPQFHQDRPGLLYLHQTKMKIYKGERQLQVRLRLAKARGQDTFSVYSVTEATEGERVPVPVATSHAIGSMPLEQVDHARIQDMQRWVVQQTEHRASSGATLSDASTSPGAKPRQEGGHNSLSAIREIVPPVAADGVTPMVGPMQPVNLICRVLAVDFCYYPDYYILYVWDGTDAHPTPLTYTSGADGGVRAGDCGTEVIVMPTKRARCDEAGTAAAAGLDTGGGGDDDVGNSTPPPPHCRHLHMPISSIAQFAGDMAAAEAALDGGGSDGAGGAGSGWEVLSSVLSVEEMPAEGSGVPLVLPTALFHLAPPGSPSPPPPPVATATPARGATAVEPEALGLAATVHLQLLPRPGDWLKLKKVVPRFVQGQLQLVFSEYSSLQPGSAEPRANGAAGSHVKRLGRLLQGGPGQHSLPVTPRDPSGWLARVCSPWHELPLRTLRQVLLQQNTCDCTPVRVLVRVMAVLNPQLPPKQNSASTDSAATSEGDPNITGIPVSELRRVLRCAVMPAIDLKAREEVVGTLLDRGSNGLTFALALLLQDATASLRAVVIGGAANLFLWEMAPPDITFTAAATEKSVPQAQQPPPALQQEQGFRPQSKLGSQSHPAVNSQPAEAATPTPQSILALSRTQTAAVTPEASVIASRAASKGAASASAARAAATAALGAAACHHEGQAKPQQSCNTDRDNFDKLIAVLRWVSDQQIPGGAWMEAVLRPMYRDRGNPWQSAVYSLEHTVLKLPPHL